MYSVLPQKAYRDIQVSDYFSPLWVKDSHPFPFCFVFIFSLYSVIYFSDYFSKLRSNGVWKVISDIFSFRTSF